MLSSVSAQIKKNAICSQLFAGGTFIATQSRAHLTLSSNPRNSFSKILVDRSTFRKLNLFL